MTFELLGSLFGNCYFGNPQPQTQPQPNPGNYGSPQSQPELEGQPPEQVNNPDQTFTYKPKIDYNPRAANTITDQLNRNNDKTIGKLGKQTNNPIQKFDYSPDIKYNPMAANTITNNGK